MTGLNDFHRLCRAGESFASKREASLLMAGLRDILPSIDALVESSARYAKATGTEVAEARMVMVEDARHLLRKLQEFGLVTRKGGMN